jgi:hypothetical protein
MMPGLALFALSLPAAVPTSAQPLVPVTRLTIRPAAEPCPALKYLFLPELDEQTPGNAALVYARAIVVVMEARRTSQQQQRVDRLIEKPVRNLTPDEVKEMRGQYRGALRELAIAARKARCDWGLDFRQEGFLLTFPEVQRLQHLVTPVALEARAQMADGRLDDAFKTLQSGFALAVNTAKGATLIQGLVGMGIGIVCVNQVEEFIQRPGAPNLYWALTALPRPFIDLHRGLQGERVSIERTVPFLRDLEKQIRSPAEIRRDLLHAARLLAGVTGHTPPAGGQGEVTLAGWAMLAYPEAKRSLLAQGWSKGRVEAMPVLQVVAIEALHELRRRRDDLFKWSHLPYPAAREALRRAERGLNGPHAGVSALPLASYLPAIEKVLLNQARLDRKIAALRCIEAVRLYAADHGGRLPARLAEVREVPVPLDPVTGKAFVYEAAGDKAALRAPDSGEWQNPSLVVNYELTLKR